MDISASSGTAVAEVHEVVQVMAHYARPNLTRAARDRTLAFFRILATLSETFVFIYIGASLARPDQVPSQPAFACVCV